MSWEEEEVVEVPFSIPDVIFKSLQLSFLKAVGDKWLHMYLSGCKHTVVNFSFIWVCVCVCLCTDKNRFMRENVSSPNCQDAVIMPVL